MSIYYATIRSGAHIKHFGIKGMHWGEWNDETRARRTGQHKSKAQLNRDRIDREKDRKEREKREGDVKRRRIMDDKDLEKRIQRLSNEKKYKDALEEDLHPGRAAVKKFMEKNGGKVLGAVALATGIVASRRIFGSAGKHLGKGNAKILKKAGNFAEDVAKEIKMPKSKGAIDLSKYRRYGREAVNFAKKNPALAIAGGTAAAGAVGGAVRVVRSAKRDHERKKAENIKRSREYDPRTGHYSYAKRPLNADEVRELERRYKAGESKAEILADMGLLKKK